MHHSPEGVLVQEVWCEEVVEVGGGGEGCSTGGIYSVYSEGQHVIYRGIYSRVLWWVGQVGSSIYRDGSMYRGISYNSYICVGIMYIRVTVGDMLHIGYISVRSRGIA